MSECSARPYRRLGAFLVLFAATVAGCGASSPRPQATTSDDPLRLEQAEIDALPADLRLTLAEDAHHYFRYIADRFVGLECEVADDGPTVNLHGDAHVEQYLVTTLGRGLGDFDEATTGPVSIDLVRLGTSIRIASRMRSWDPDALWQRFLEGYLAALEDEDAAAPEPRFAVRTRATFQDDHGALLDWCDSLFQSTSSVEAARVEVALDSYVEMLARHRPGLEPRAYEVVTIGPHRLGVGSRRASNYLIRTRGPTDDPSDDLILEAKEVTRNPRATCLPISRRTDALRILVADARLAYAPFQDVGFVELNGRPYWIHEWVNDYTELDVSDSSLTLTELQEVLYDVGVQLGRGHPRGLGDPYEAELRIDLRRFLIREADSIWRRAGALADAVWGAWETMR